MGPPANQLTPSLHEPTLRAALIRCIYGRSSVQLAWLNETTPLLRFESGVLQGDPYSPLIFNVCFKTLIKVIKQPQYQQLGYMWGAADALHRRAWMQFYDDAALISDDTKGAQTLFDIATVWQLRPVSTSLMRGRADTSGI